jgi:hypothetical protein
MLRARRALAALGAALGVGLAGAPGLPSADALSAGGSAASRETQQIAQFNLTPPRGRSEAAGVAEILRHDHGFAVAVVAHGLRPNTAHDAYAIWLYSGPRHQHLLGVVRPPVGANGRISSAGQLPADWRSFRHLVISLEPRAHPKRPHRIVLTGRLPQGSRAHRTRA